MLFLWYKHPLGSARYVLNNAMIITILFILTSKFTKCSKYSVVDKKVVSV